MQSDKQDLILLMESYKNSIDLNMALSKQIQDVCTKIVILDQNVDWVCRNQAAMLTRCSSNKFSLLI